ncbi:M16 family metallopeptidase [Neptunicella marina]|uniref:Insulinase family protein n=1 Tax=Neptunicella marina TaxID=2125989 RepID=A0A8J6IUV4_9ALTE|nr:pitrilysin family protein [Neptunicella marina]MBC3766624.1 insulinase family protein [Neptunicella marina]
MKTIFKPLVGLLLSSVAFFSSAEQFQLPEYQKVTLDNGLTLYLMEQHEVPLIEVKVQLKAGAINNNKAGLANLTAETLMLGTQQTPKSELDAQLDFIGANMNSSAGLESSALSASFVNKDADKVLELLKQVLTAPAFDNEEFDKFKQRYLSQLDEKRQSPKAVIYDYFNQLLYRNHPYASIQDGDKHSIESINLADVKNFYQQFYTPDNAALIVVGDFDSDKMLSKLKILLKDWQGKTTKPLMLTGIDPAQQANVLLVNKADAIESTFVIGGPGIKRSNPDYVELTVLNTILGGRFTSWLNDALRVNAGLTYGARSSFSANKYAGSFSIYTFTKTATTEQAIDLALSTYQKLWEPGIDIQTLESAKAYVKGQFPPKYETSAELADLLGNMFIYDFDQQFINQFNQRVSKLDVERANQLVKRYFPRDNLQFVVVGKAAEIKSKLEKYGKVYQTDIDKAEVSF